MTALKMCGTFERQVFVSFVLNYSPFSGFGYDVTIVKSALNIKDIALNLQ